MQIALERTLRILIACCLISSACAGGRELRNSRTSTLARNTRHHYNNLLYTIRIRVDPDGFVCAYLCVLWQKFYTFDGTRRNVGTHTDTLTDTLQPAVAAEKVWKRKLYKIESTYPEEVDDVELFAGEMNVRRRRRRVGCVLSCVECSAKRVFIQYTFSCRHH